MFNGIIAVDLFNDSNSYSRISSTITKNASGHSFLVCAMEYEMDQMNGIGLNF